jgi:hypothetical protein
MDTLLAICAAVIAAVYLIILLSVRKSYKKLQQELEDLKAKQKKQFYNNWNKKRV